MSPSGAEVIRQIKQQVEEVDPAQVSEHLGNGVTVVDVRESEEWDRGHIPGAVHVPRGRYGRHLLLPEIGPEGQAKLLDAKGLLLGAGGLGSPIALYLAAAGVGTLGIVDDDVVDLSNLQRQVIHTTDRVGVPKVDSAEQSIGDLNPDVQVRKYQVRLDASNIVDIIKDYD